MSEMHVTVHDLALFDDEELARELERRGYTVRPNSRARQQLSWNRKSPIPDHIDFKAEAVDKIREQITPELLRFVDREVPGMKPETTETVHSAVLRII